MKNLDVIADPEDVITKAYADGIALTPGPPGPPGPSGQAAGKIFYYSVTDDSDISTYKTMLASPSGAAEQTVVNNCSSTTDFLVASFATDPGIPGAVDFPPGTAFRRLYGMVNRGSARYHMILYIRNQAGTETLLSDELSPEFSSTSVGMVEWAASFISGVPIVATDRLVTKLYVQRVSGTSPVTVTTYFEGFNFASHIQTTISAGAQGPVGPGVATGGTVGQVLTKDSSTDYDTSWQNPDVTKAYVDARTPKITVSSSQPSSPAVNDVWIDTAGTTGGGGGIEEAPVDGSSYLRKDADWLETAPILVLGPSDAVPGGTPAGTLIARKVS